MRDHAAADDHLPGRLAGGSRRALPASSATAAAASAAADGMPRRNDGPVRHGLPAAAAATSAAAVTDARGRARLTPDLRRRRESAPHFLSFKKSGPVQSAPGRLSISCVKAQHSRV
jgi:hypothetical protein